MMDKKINSSTAVSVMLAIAVFVSLFNTVIVGDIAFSVDKEISSLKTQFADLKMQQEEILRPANLEIIKINQSTCVECGNVEGIDEILNEVKKYNVKITSEKQLDVTDTEAKELLSKYNIKRIPSVIVRGETEKIENVKFILENTSEMIDSTAIFTKKTPVYVDLVKNKVIGLVSATIINDSECVDCVDMSFILKNIVQAGVSINKKLVLEYISPTASEILSKYNIQKVPTIILSSELNEYSNIADNWKNVGTVESDGAYVFRSKIPPYKNLLTGEIKGLVKLTNIVDDSCDLCYDVSIHKGILEGFGMVFSEEETYDINSTIGKKLVEDYNITSVPTVMLSKDASAYINFENIWGNVGTVEKNGQFVFRDVGVFQKVYKNLETNTLVNHIEENSTEKPVEAIIK